MLTVFKASTLDKASTNLKQSMKHVTVLFKRKQRFSCIENDRRNWYAKATKNHWLMLGREASSWWDKGSRF